MRTHAARPLSTLAILALGALAPSTAAALSIEDVPIWRLQVKVTVGDVSNAGTDDAVFVQFTGGDSNRFWLNYGRNDFERNSTFTYDVVAPGVGAVKDISFFKFGKTGNDGTCVKRLQLYINGLTTPLYDRSFGTCQWIDTSGSYSNSVTMSSSTLRAYSGWTLSFSHLLPPTRISADAVESLVEGAVGDALHGEDSIYWSLSGSEFVTVTRSSSSRQAVDLDFAASLDNWADPTVDVDFGITWSCSGGQLSITSSNPTVEIDGSLWLDILTLGIQALIFEVVENKVERALSSIGINVSTSVSSCPSTVSIDSAGDVVLTW